MSVQCHYYSLLSLGVGLGTQDYTNGTFPSAWNLRRITPIISKSTDNSLPSGYGQISVQLPVARKRNERHVNSTVDHSTRPVQQSLEVSLLELEPSSA